MREVKSMKSFPENDSPKPLKSEGSQDSNQSKEQKPIQYCSFEYYCVYLLFWFIFFLLVGGASVGFKLTYDDIMTMLTLSLFLAWVTKLFIKAAQLPYKLTSKKPKRKSSGVKWYMNPFEGCIYYEDGREDHLW